MRRWLAIDHGTRRWGVAVAGETDALASPVEVIDAEPVEQALARVIEIAAEYRADGIVVGWPLNMDDTEGPQGRLARELAIRLADECDLDVRLWDERLSSFTADEALAGQLTRRKRRARQDAVAAAVILRDFLTTDGPSIAPRPADPRSG